MNISAIYKTKTFEEERVEKEQTLNKKKELFLKMKQQNTNLQKNEITNNTNSDSTASDTNEIVKLKAQCNNLLSQRDKLQKQNDKLKEKIQQCKMENNKQNKKIRELKERLRVADKIIEQNQIQHQAQQEKIRDLQKQVWYWKEYSERNSISELQKQVEELHNRINDKERLRKHCIQEVESLKKRLKTMQNMQCNDLTQEYKKRHSKLQTKYNELLQNYRACMDIKSATRTITSLTNVNKNLRYVNWKLATYIQQHKIMNYISYFLSFYNNPYTLPKANKKSITKASVNNDQANIVQIRKPHYMFKGLVETIQTTKQNIIYKDDYINRYLTKFGYIKKKDSVFYFCSVDGGEYVINDYETIQQYENGTPCRAKAFNGRATIVKFYVSNNQKKRNTIDAITKQKRRNKRGNKFNNQLFDYYAKQFKDISVLIVGYKYKTTYTTIFTRCGLNVIWCDPSKYKQDSLLDKYRQCDVAILCADHMSHATLDKIDIHDNPKAQLIYNDTAYRILSRIKYALVQMNKI